MATMVTRMCLDVTLLCTLLFASSVTDARSRQVIHITSISVFLKSVCVWVGLLV